MDLDFIVEQERVLAVEGVSKAGAELSERADVDLSSFGASMPLLAERSWQEPMPLQA